MWTTRATCGIRTQTERGGSVGLSGTPPMSSTPRSPQAANANGAEESRRVQRQVFFEHDTGGEVLLDSVATSPEQLARALMRLLGASAAAELLGNALNYISSNKPGELSLLSPHTNDETSTFAEEDDLSREQLQEIKARTMYQMVEEIEDGKSKLLFLTNPQADLIASSSEGVQRMLDALEVPKPSLVIELLKSPGFRGFTTSYTEEFLQNMNGGAFLGCLHARPPFRNREEEREAEAKLDVFMSDVIIPLAAQTHAVVLCDAIPVACSLSTSFLRMFALMKAKWSGPLPFTVISLSVATQRLYKNPDENAHWRSIRRASNAWRQRDGKLLEMASADTNVSIDDLDTAASCIILCDNIHPKRETLDKKPFGHLKQSLVRHLSASVPSLALRTGFSAKGAIGNANTSALDVISDRVQSGTPVLALDVRHRLPLVLSSDDIAGGKDQQRAALIGEAKKQVDEWREELLADEEGKPPLAETLDTCTLAFLKEALESDGGVAAHAATKNAEKQVLVPLHEAIERAKDEGSQTLVCDHTVPPATAAQIAELARWHSDCVFRDAWKVRRDMEEHERNGRTYFDFYGEEKIFACEAHTRTILSSPNFYHANLTNMEGVQKLVNQIVRLDRLPSQNSLQGLLLIREAWRAHDVAMLLASRYKRICKALFAMQLFVSWLVVAGSGTYADEATQGQNIHGVFGLAVMFSILVSLDGMLNPKARWRQLRSSAMSLQSLIWQYRTRTGPFEIDDSQSDSSRSENVLCSMLNHWRDELLAGASLKTSNLEREYPAHVYRHYQDSGTLPTSLADQDDHQSPVQPTRYIKLRIEPMMSFYAHRVPEYSRHGFILKVTCLLLGVVSSVLARYELLAWVMVATAAATVVTSWAEFSEDTRKVERYSSAVNALKKLLTWWMSLGEVEKASRESIAHLVLEGEAIITEEHRSWTSTANKQETSTGTETSQESGGKDEMQSPGTMV